MHIYAFEKLQVWQEARSLTVSMYHLTTHFPLGGKVWNGQPNQAGQSFYSFQYC